MFQQNVSYCIFPHEVLCKRQVEINFENSNELCQKACPFQCESLKYELLTHRSNYPTKQYSQYLKQYIDGAPDDSDEAFKFIKSKVAKVVIKFDYSSYLVFEETPALTLDQLFGTVGGNFGLFFGISILSALEIVDILIEIIMIIYRHIRGY